MTSKVEIPVNETPNLSLTQGPPLDIIPGKQIPQRMSSGLSAPVTPVDDKVTVEEKTGRWSDAEHNIFLEGLEKHGKQWKTISTMIGTRTVVQVRTHAQKFFQKMDRNKNKSKAPSVPVLSQAHNRASKRKSLPSSLPSRKKTCKSPVSPKQTVPRTSSLSLVNTSCSSDIPTFVSTSSLSSGNWSTESPVGVNEFDLVDSLCDNKDPLIEVEESLVEPHADTAPQDDPLDWLIDGGIGHLPESSLDQAPIFPDSLEITSGDYGLDENNDQNVQYPVLQDIADPKVTVQSLFLEDGDNHLP